MEYKEIIKEKKTKNIFEDSLLEKKIKKPLSEQDILYLQDIFMIPGIHHIKVDSVISGRFIINSMLNSLNYYRNIGCLSAYHLPIQEPIVDIYQELAKKNYFQNPDVNLYDFFLEDFDCDFLWIESSQNLELSEWFPVFEQQTINMNLHKLMPLIIVSYGDYH